METANGNHGHDLLQCHTVPSVLRPPVHYGEVHTVNTISLYNTAAAVQKTTAKWLPDMKSAHDDFKNEVETATLRKLMRVTGSSLCIVVLLVPIPDQDVIGDVPIIAQRLSRWSNGRNCCGLLEVG